MCVQHRGGKIYQAGKLKSSSLSLCFIQAGCEVEKFVCCERERERFSSSLDFAALQRIDRERGKERERKKLMRGNCSEWILLRNHAPPSLSLSPPSPTTNNEGTNAELRAANHRRRCFCFCRLPGQATHSQQKRKTHTAYTAHNSLPHSQKNALVRTLSHIEDQCECKRRAAAG